MKTIKCKLTVYFAEPFWVGVFERICDGKLSVAKVTFGAEPKDYDIQEFDLNLEKSYNKRYQASLIENSRFVQRHGLDMFMQIQKETYTCSKCGGIISVHDGACSECREKAT